jgi:hypothetical protein
MMRRIWEKDDFVVVVTLHTIKIYSIIIPSLLNNLSMTNDFFVIDLALCLIITCFQFSVLFLNRLFLFFLESTPWLNSTICLNSTKMFFWTRRKNDFWLDFHYIITAWLFDEFDGNNRLSFDMHHWWIRIVKIDRTLNQTNHYLGEILRFAFDIKWSDFYIYDLFGLQQRNKWE